MQVHGPARSLLTAERVALNFLQRMSGIATATRAMVDAVQVQPHCHGIAACRLPDTLYLQLSNMSSVQCTEELSSTGIGRSGGNRAGRMG